ncbi:MAG TPA: hypothetical protein VFI47_30270 [Acidimicrobiales bacterium]|nr:hypothetical protein [Acidimicrobiales bacterium]
MRKQAGVVVLLLAVVGGCMDSDSRGDEWSASEHVPDDSVEPIEGDYSDGTWGVYVDTEGRICGATQSADAASGVCGSMDDLAVTLHDTDGQPVVLFGMVPEGTEGISTPDAQESRTPDMVW